VDLALLGELAGQALLLALRIAIFLDVGLGALKDGRALLLIVLKKKLVTVQADTFDQDNKYVNYASDPKEGDK
jgi:hypothetical protein